MNILFEFISNHLHLMLVNVKIMMFWDVALFLIDGYQHFM